ncbi:EAL domain-containing protein/glycosyl transferase [Halomicronema hongdechloris C2206]|uniref:EAL domain-containing protein/glycosyl transferase n=1 Tax=Halomicronema hongdechloris C2206 TaxID=1641165 RepID=A0A1Z3HJM7_9CYAN|nr:hormogonium polysaccharide biosynthesis glycosyltransferase HpsE [Halomicronema hongdechloris]ASC70500.1 EAL domain-containing protein/glycosyl transferase [Halomicronema hongdechloris C2206]
MISGIPTQQLDISVAIPTYNGAQRLPCLLDRLRSQQHVDHITWEIIVCDNNSLDETAQVTQQYQRTWTGAAELQYCFVAEQGAAFARQRAVESARGKLIAFLDDDNLPEDDWVAKAWNFAQQHPEAGAFGSQIHGDFEQAPPEEFKHIACFLAIVERGPNPHRYDQHTKVLPPGAGLVVRRDAWLQSVPRRLFLNNKGKAAGLASEDLEAILYIRKAGWEVWYNPAMVVYHQIPKGRLQKEYLVTLIRCVGLSRFYIRILSTSAWKRPLLLPLYIVNDLRKLLLHIIREKREPYKNLLFACEREYLFSTLSSPIFIARKGLKDYGKTTLSGLSKDKCKTVIDQIESGFENNLFCLYQQPIFSTDNCLNDPLNYEVLVRLLSCTLNSDSPTTRLLLPKDFMPIAEYYELTKTIDRWVIRTLFNSIKRSSPQKNCQANYSINLSQASIRDQYFSVFLSDLLNRHQFPAENFWIEIPEHAAKTYPDAVARLTHEIEEIGCNIILDDFRDPGLLRQLPETSIYHFKLSFLSLELHMKSLVRLQEFRNIIEHANSSKITIIAKGIEKKLMLDVAKRLGIPYVQGYQLKKPLPLENLFWANCFRDVS